MRQGILGIVFIMLSLASSATQAHSSIFHHAESLEGAAHWLVHGLITLPLAFVIWGLVRVVERWLAKAKQ